MIFHHCGASIRSVHDSVTISGGCQTAGRGSMGSSSRRRVVACALAMAGALLSGTLAEAQSVDCGRLQMQIAQASSGDPAASRNAAAAQKQRSELDRTVAY